MRGCVIGLGYVGLPVAALLAGAGHEILGVDIDPGVRAAVAQGTVSSAEPGLSEALASALASGRLRVGARPEPADFFVIAVPTPIRGRARRRADISAVEAAATALAPVLRPGNLVVVESTCPPGVTERVVLPLLETRSGLRGGVDFFLAYCPERVLPGRILEELVEGERVVGGINPASTAAARAVYAGFVRGAIAETDAMTAELVKLMENTHRDLNIALSNEFALVAESLGVDVWAAIALANRHPRVHLLQPGPGVGGHCIAVDPWFVVGAAPGLTPLISAGRAVNDRMPRHVVDLIDDALAGLAGRRLVALGLAYKPDVDDTRESPALDVIDLLRAGGAEVRPHDPLVQPGPGVPALARDADALVLLVHHTAYAELDPAALAPVMRRRVAVDTRAALPLFRWIEAGFAVVRLGDGVRRVSAGGGTRGRAAWTA